MSKITILPPISKLSPFAPISNIIDTNYSHFPFMSNEASLLSRILLIGAGLL